MDSKEILEKLPYVKPFLFVDALTRIDEKGAEGSFTFSKSLEFYKGHFIDSPVTPGAILAECCAQIGVVCLGIYLLSQDEKINIGKLQIGLSSSEMEFLLPVLPGEKVVVYSEKIFFRFNKLKCKVKMYNIEEKLVCRGIISGMIKSRNDA